MGLALMLAPAAQAESVHSLVARLIGATDPALERMIAYADDIRGKNTSGLAGYQHQKLVELRDRCQAIAAGQYDATSLDAFGKLLYLIETIDSNLLRQYGAGHDQQQALHRLFTTEVKPKLQEAHGLTPELLQERGL